MGHYANVNTISNVVEQVITATADYVATLEGNWIKTSYNTHGGVHYFPDSNEPDTSKPPIRVNYAAVGMMYYPEYDLFADAQLYPSWTLNTTTGTWVPPIPIPGSIYDYIWNEATLTWIYVGQ